MKIIEVNNLTKKEGKKNLLEDISFSLEEGEILGVVGKNGSGKTTLLKSIVGLIHPTSGEVIINGYDLKKDYEKAIKNVGCMIEVPVMYDYLSGKDNLEVYRMMFKGIPKSRVDEIIKLISLEGSEYKKLKIYSLGMRERLGIGVTLLNNPKLLILDEPTNGLDPIGIRDFRNFIKSLKGVSVIITSHMLNEIENICDKVMFIDNGKLIDIKNVNHNKKKYKFYVDNIPLTKKILYPYKTNRELEIEVTNEEYLLISEELIKNNIKIFKVSESSSLESDFLSLIGEEND